MAWPVYCLNHLSAFEFFGLFRLGSSSDSVSISLLFARSCNLEMIASSSDPAFSEAFFLAKDPAFFLPGFEEEEDEEAGGKVGKGGKGGKLKVPIKPS